MHSLKTNRKIHPIKSHQNLINTTQNKHTEAKPHLCCTKIEFWSSVFHKNVQYPTKFQFILKWPKKIEEEEFCMWGVGNFIGTPVKFNLVRMIGAAAARAKRQLTNYLITIFRLYSLALRTFFRVPKAAVQLWLHSSFGR